jgi:hypothetical protein|tara:strand:+ start:40 stop:336 length:297 start_codon:yes stop_codon:yes gene_type:complete
VVKKKQAPYTESLIPKGAVTYSTSCNLVKIIAKTIVKSKLKIEKFLHPAIIALWQIVIVHPEVNKIMVFNKGIFQGSNVVKKTGGHCPPSTILGLKLT